MDIMIREALHYFIPFVIVKWNMYVCLFSTKKSYLINMGVLSIVLQLRSNDGNLRQS